MINTYHTSFSGMLAASFGLQNASNNIANMQTPGFKRNDISYRCLGTGVTTGEASINFSAGKQLAGNHPTDLAISGSGFFIIKIKNGELLYTRNGEFLFNEKGILTDRHSQGEVQGLDDRGNLISIAEKGADTAAGLATRTVWLSGQLLPVGKTQQEKEFDTSPLKNNFRNIECKIDNVFDKAGKPHTLRLILESTRMPPHHAGNLKDEGTSWELLQILCDDATIQTGYNKPLVFSSGGFLRPGESSLHCTVDGNPLTLEFGNFNASADKAVQLKSKDSPENALSGTSIKVFQQDGYAEGKPIQFSINDKGQIAYQYDNGQTINGHHLAIGQFSHSEQALERINGNLFRAKTGADRQIVKPGEAGAGTLMTNTLESANIDSTTEFATIVVLQRMFQSCSQIMNIDKELLEGLYKR